MYQADKDPVALKADKTKLTLDIEGVVRTKLNAVRKEYWVVLFTVYDALKKFAVKLGVRLKVVELNEGVAMYTDGSVKR